MFRIIPEGLSYREHILLKNGQGLFLKPAVSEDIPRIEKFMNTVSRESLRMRFMASVSQVSQNIIKELCSGDFQQSGCLLATTGESTEAKVVGLGNYISINNGQTADVAFLIEDKFQGKGVGTLLLERLAGLAAANGFVEFEADVLSDNQTMINVFKSSGFEKHRVWNSDVVHIELPVSGAAALWERAGLRERIAVANSLEPLLRPKAVAIIGISRDTSSIGNLIFSNIHNADFKGKAYPVNPQAQSINGNKVYASPKDIPERIDLAVIAVPAKKVFKAAKESIKAGARGLVVVSAGFADAGAKGLKRQKNLVELVRSQGVRLLGPSCLGLMNTDPGVRLNASLAPQIMQAGQAGFFSHSAALGLVILDYAKQRGVDFTTFVSAGNRADVSGNDLLQYWEEDHHTKMAILYLETFGNPRRFVRIARRMAYKKPVLCIKSARSIEGKKAAEAKSGADVGGELELEALFHQTGIILAPTLEDLFDVAVVLSHQPLPKGDGVSIVANSSGMATLFADACETNNLNIKGPGVVDLGAFTSPVKYKSAVKKALLHKDVDALLIGFACVGNCDPVSVADAIRHGVIAAEEKTKIEKTVLLCFMGVTGTMSFAEEGGNENGKRKFPAFRFPESAANALARIVRYVEFKKQPLGKLVWYNDIQSDKARRLVQDKLSVAAEPGQVLKLEKELSITLLKYFGIETVSKKTKSKIIFQIKVKPDRLFGPLIELKKDGFRPLVRITPLTDRDLEITMKEFQIKNNRALNQVLGRISQMIEEIPWLWELEVNFIGGSKAIVNTNLLIKIKSGGVERPTY